MNDQEKFLQNGGIKSMHIC